VMESMKFLHWRSQPFPLSTDCGRGGKAMPDFQWRPNP
jgi:hypothetical protein